MIFNNISFIGAGKVGTSLGKYFTEKGYNISGMYNKTQPSLLESCNFLKTKPFYDLQELVCNSDIIFITTPDNVINTVCDELVSLQNLKGKFFCHCSGSLSSKVLSKINNYGAYTYSLHPLWAFSDKFTSYKNFQNAYISLEGTQSKISTIEDFITTLGNNFFLLSSENKSLYHASTVSVSNFVLALIKQGSDYLKLCGVDNESAIKALTPLILNNINNFNDKGLLNSLTGPIERGDFETISNHISSIPEEDIDLYKNLSRKLLALAKEKNIARDYSQLDKIL